MKQLVALLACALAVGLMACSPKLTASVGEGRASTSEACEFPSPPTVVTEQGDAVLQYWEFEDRELWFGPTLPSDSAYLQYRRLVAQAGADRMRPAQHVPDGERGSERWRRELHNVERAYSSQAGTLRPAGCLDALLFAYQHRRYSQLRRPTEFLASILRKRVGKRTMLRVYFGAGSTLFPPSEVYGLAEAGRDVDAGWDYIAMLHNHTVQDVGTRIRLGVPAPSVSDVQLLRGLVESDNLDQIWVTNGMYTIEIDAGDLEQYLGPE